MKRIIYFLLASLALNSPLLAQVSHGPLSIGQLDPRYVNVSSDTMTGPLIVASSVTANNFYGNGSGLTGVTGATDNTKVLKAGDTMTGQLTLSGSTLTVTGSAFSVGGSTLVVTAGNVGIGTTGPTTTLDVIGVLEYIPMRFVKNTNEISGAQSSLIGKAISTGDMSDTFGVRQQYRIQDNAGVDNLIGLLEVTRDGADNKGSFSFKAGTGGTQEFLTIRNTGNVGIGDTAPSEKLEVAGGIASYSRTMAQLLAITPSQVGVQYFCNNCTPAKMVVSTGTATGNFADIIGGTFQ